MLIQFALSGAAVGFVFWIYIGWRMGKAAPNALGTEALAPSWFLDYSNDQLLRNFRVGPCGNEYMRQVMELSRPVFDARRVRDLSITVSADISGPDRYLISIHNAGRHTYTDVRVHYETLLLDAESFGCDTTHMPTELSRIAGEAVSVDTIPPGTTARVARKGYGSHDQYDGPRETAVDLDYCLEGKQMTGQDRRWCHCNVELPNARSG